MRAANSLKKSAEEVLGTLDQEKREALRPVIMGTPYAAPAVTSFPIDGHAVSDCLAHSGNGPFWA